MNPIREELVSGPEAPPVVASSRGSGPARNGEQRAPVLPGGTCAAGSAGRGTPRIGHYYRGGPAIQPEWLAGRKLLVVALTDPDDVHTPVADSDLHARKGQPMPDLTAPRERIVTVRAMDDEGAIVVDVIRVWDGVPA